MAVALENFAALIGEEVGRCSFWSGSFIGRPESIFVNPFERGEIGPDLFQAACSMGLEGLVSKHRDRPYRGGRQKFWIKVKNRCHLAIEREL